MIPETSYTCESMSVLHQSLLILGGFAIGWFAHAKAPEGTDRKLWLKGKRLYRKAARSGIET